MNPVELYVTLAEAHGTVLNWECTPGHHRRLQAAIEALQGLIETMPQDERAEQAFR